ncbi:MAG: endo-1,4-beta-xylanase [Bacteroidaceae bacterium]|nr:endo-1,4-beta-xylanase [Bacteroidaceae bacterium]
MRNKLFMLLLAGTAVCGVANAQLSKNPDKFLGNITTRYNVDVEDGGKKFIFSNLWNQITPENESKWASIEGSRGSYNWGSDNAYNYAKNHNFPFKFHCLIWGSQYPDWLNSLSTAEQYKAIVNWMDAIKRHYPHIDMIDVVNEAVPGHAPAPYKAALGGDGSTGYDWIIKAFEMAYERWPDAILIYNDYNTFQYQKDQFIELVKVLRDAGAPVDAYGCQSHDLTNMSFSDFKSAMSEIQNALKMPMYSTEYDIGTTDDAQQKKQYSDQIKYMWEQPYCAGITLWGFIYGATWTTDGNSGIIKNGKDRPAMTWLREYMATDAAKNAKSPFPGMKKEASLYIKPSQYSTTINEPMTITVRASMRTKTIDSINLYLNNKLLKTFKETPYQVEYTPTTAGSYTLKAIVYSTDSNKYERLGGFKAHRPRAPYKNTAAAIPGTIQAEAFDTGGEGVSFHDNDSKNEGVSTFRTDGEGVDIVTGNSGYAIGYTNPDEWLEYTVDIAEDGYYDVSATVSSGVNNASFKLSLNKDDVITDISDNFVAPCLQSNNWDTYSTISKRLTYKFTAGRHILRLTIVGGSINVDKITFTKANINEGIKLGFTKTPKYGYKGTESTIEVKPTLGADAVASVSLYVNDKLVGTKTSAPYEFSYKPSAAGTFNLKAMAKDTLGAESMFFTDTYKVRSSYSSTPQIPGKIQFEAFDKGGEGFTFHDSDSKNEGAATSYRTDGEGVDIDNGGTGRVIGYTLVNEWMEYTFNVTQAGSYLYTLHASSGTTGSQISLYWLNENGNVSSSPFKTISITQTANNSWNTYKDFKGAFANLTEGRKTMRVKITGAYCNLDYIQLDIDVPDNVNEISEYSEYRIYTKEGIFVAALTARQCELADKIILLTGVSGVYIAKDTATGESIKLAVE